MSDNRDPAIKLFGKTIQLPVSGEVPETGWEEEKVEDEEVIDGEEDGGCDELVKEPMNEKNDEEDHKNEELAATEEQLTNSGPANSESENPKTPSLDPLLAKSVKPEEEQSEANNSKEKPALKKPDKILPCPRCNSLDTKFCYYNNYNVNQPRHFCKNCQRYWTAGGTMRNVPVGAGRRKNKNSANHYRHITVSEAMQTVRTDHSEVVPHRIPLKPNGTVLTFSADAPLCESMSSALSLADKSMKNCYRNGFHVPEEQTIAVPNGVEIGDEQSIGPSVIASTISTEDGGNRVNLPEPAAARSYPGFTQIPCFPPGPWPYPWNAAQWRTPIPPQSAPPPPPYCNPSFPVSFFPATAYWGCTMPGAWGIPWISPPSPSAASCGSGSNSPTLGKHSREENSLKQSDIDKEDPAEKNNSERCLWIPKTLRIDDPGEAARSSIWTTLGLKNDKVEGISGGGLFKAFHSKSEERSRTVGASQVLHANPAALSRSIRFCENS